MRPLQSFACNNSESAQEFPSDILTPTGASPSTSGLSLNLVLENVTEDVLREMDATQLCQFIIDARRSILSPSVGKNHTQNKSFPFFLTSLPFFITPKNDCIGSSIASGKL